MHRLFIARLAWLVGLTLAGAADLRAAEPRGEPEKSVKPATFVVEEALDVRYHDADRRQVLDVYRPSGIEKRPVVLFVHGGAWIIGDKNFFGLYRNVGRYLARQGLVAVLVNYRLSPVVRHPAHIQDIARAFAWTRKNIGKYGGDPDRVVLSGHSAGGHLVALLATDPTWLNDPQLGMSPTDRAAIRGVVPVSGVYRIPGAGDLSRAAVNLLMILSLNDAARTTRGVTGKMDEVNPFRIVFGDDPKTWRAASPIYHVRKDVPPFLVLYAERELPTLSLMAREFGAALESAGATVEVRRVPECHHNTILFRLNEPGNATAELLLPFIEKVTR